MRFIDEYLDVDIVIAVHGMGSLSRLCCVVHACRSDSTLKATSGTIVESCITFAICRHYVDEGG